MPDELKSIARKMIAEANIQGCPGAYLATGHSTNNISIIHQQIRCINLAWALVKLRKVKHGSVVGIVGGCFSGLMLAVGLAIQRRCIVYIYEKESQLLQRFRRSPYRFISTNLNSRDLPPRYNLRYSRPIYDLPIFAWREGTASEVAHRWLREFQDYCVRLPIFLRTNHEVTECTQNGSGVMLQVNVGGTTRPDPVDLAILATGFGSEQNMFQVEDWSYWDSGSPLQYRPGRRAREKERVLISGCGDSGVVELMHYVFRDFRQDNIASYFPAGFRVESYVQPMLEDSRLWAIRYSRELDRFDRKVISELCWFFTEKEFRDRNPHLETDLSRRLNGKEKQLYEMEEALFKRLTAILKAKGLNFESSFASEQDIYRRERRLVALSQADQFAIRDELHGSIADFASAELDLKMGDMKLEAFFSLEPIRDHLLDRFEIWMNDSTPSPYTEKIAPVNLIYLKLCQSIENIRYIPGRVKGVKDLGARYAVRFDGGTDQEFERVATRFGMRHGEATQKMIGLSPRRLNFGDWLLETPIVERTKDKAHGITSLERLDVAREALLKGTAVLFGTALPGQGTEPVLNKRWYDAIIFLRQRGALTTGDPKSDDPETWLRNRLRRGARVTYDRYVEL